jgi:hypothetical protein
MYTLQAIPSMSSFVSVLVMKYNADIPSMLPRQAMDALFILSITLQNDSIEQSGFPEKEMALSEIEYIVFLSIFVFFPLTSPPIGVKSPRISEGMEVSVVGFLKPSRFNDVTKFFSEDFAMHGKIDSNRKNDRKSLVEYNLGRYIALLFI